MTGWSTSPKSRRASRTRRSTSWSVASGLTRRRQWRSFGQALALSDYPESFPRDFRVAYRPTPRELVIGCRLPPVTVIPVIRDYRYVKARSEIDELPRPMKEIKDLYGRSTIYKGADGLWHGRVSMGLTDQGRKDRRHVSSKSKTVVTEKVAEWERTRDDGLAQEIRENWTVEAWLTHWLEHLSRPFVKQGTYEGYRAAVNVHLIPGIGRHQLHTLRPEHLERLYVSMLKLSTRRGTPMSPGRVHQVHRTIRTALNEAVRRGHLARNPAEMAKTPPVNDYDVEPYTVDELQQLFVAAQQRAQRRTLGLRPGPGPAARGSVGPSVG